MAKSARLLVVLCILIMIVLQSPQFVRAQQGNVLRVPQTGHRIANDFLAYYQGVANPERIFGYPITDSFQDESNPNLMIQYFQKARFELHSDAIPELRVQLTPLGKYLYDEAAGTPVTIPANFPACRSFEQETGFQVCYTFLEFFNANGGVSQFGYPISNFLLQNERIVQYFQRARFEWHPELPPGQRVVISDLGALYFQKQGENPNRLRPQQLDGNTLETILSLRARAFTQQVVTDRAGNQTIFVAVQAQDMQPVSGAQVVLNIHYPDGQVQQIELPELTNSHGIASYTYPFVSQLRGPVQIEVIVKYGKLEGTTTTSYRIWY